MKLDINQLLSSGACEGPFRRAHPVTLTPWRRFVRLIRQLRYRT